MARILDGGVNNCVEYILMTKDTFHRVCAISRVHGHLRDTISGSISFDDQVPTYDRPITLDEQLEHKSTGGSFVIKLRLIYGMITFNSVHFRSIVIRKQLLFFFCFNFINELIKERMCSMLLFFLSLIHSIIINNNTNYND